MTEEVFHNPSEEKERRGELRLSLQILTSGFSADYINCFSSLYKSLKAGNYEFRLPEYGTYVEQRLRHFYPNPDVNDGEIFEASSIYYEGLSDESLISFNDGISQINTLVSSSASIDDIKAQADTFTEKYLYNKYIGENPKRFLEILDRMKKQGM